MSHYSVKIYNRMQSNRPTYTWFIDMQKAFDWIDKDFLFL